jgi:hypothetical protein
MGPPRRKHKHRPKKHKAPAPALHPAGAGVSVPRTTSPADDVERESSWDAARSGRDLERE